MPEEQQVRKIKCPHCGWIRTVPVGATDEGSWASVVRGLPEAMKAAAEKIKAAIADSQPHAVNAWIDLPACPNCNRTYRFNARTGQVTK